MGVEHVESVADLACRTALAFRGVANITIPTDVQMSEKQNRSARNLKHHTSRHFAGSASIPNPADVRRAAEILIAAKKVAILAAPARWVPAISSKGWRTFSELRSLKPCWESLGARRQPIHHRRHRTSGDQAIAGSDGKLRHFSDCRQLVSIRGIPAQARPSAGRADRSKPDPARLSFMLCGSTNHFWANTYLPPKRTFLVGK